MPDPLLKFLGTEEEHAAMARTAERMGASLTRTDPFLFVRCPGPSRPLLARIDLAGYPDALPDVRFLDPSGPATPDAPPSGARSHWPVDAPVFARGGRLCLCLGGTRDYLALHGNPGSRLSLPNLVAVLILCCQGRGRSAVRRPAGRIPHAHRQAR